MQIFAISALVNGLVAFLFSFFIILYNPKEKINKLYFLLGIAMTVWSFGYWQWQLSNNAVAAIFWVRILSIGSTMIPVFYFHWASVLLGKEKSEKNKIRFSYVFAFFILIFSFSNLFIAGVEQKMVFLFWPVPGVLYNLYFIFIYCILVAYSLVLLFKALHNSSGEKKAQIIYVLIGSIIGFGGGLTNFFLWYNIPVLPYGNFLVAFYSLFLGYAVIKHRLFEIKIVATEVFIFLIWIFLLVRILLSGNYQELLINITTFLAVITTGILLVRVALRDLQQKDQIEKMAAVVQRAYEIEKKAHEDLKKTDEVKSQFMVITNHHLRTPLTAIKWYIDLLSSGRYGEVPAKAKEVKDRIKISTEDEIKIVDDLLNVSQFQLGKEITQPKQGVNIETMLKKIADNLIPETFQKNIYLKVEKENQNQVIPLISADESKLTVALANIVDNAVKYTEKGGVTVTIKIEKEPYGEQAIKNLKIIVQDTGIGMDETELKNIFTKTFERGEQAQKLFAVGKGIGLYLSAKIIEAHKGKIWAESDGHNKGSTFYVDLPVV